MSLSFLTYLSKAQISWHIFSHKKNVFGVLLGQKYTECRSQKNAFFPEYFTFCSLRWRSSALSRFTLDKCPYSLALRKFKTLLLMWQVLFWSPLDMILNFVAPYSSSRSFTRFTFRLGCKLMKSSLSSSRISSVSADSSSTNSVLTGAFELLGLDLRTNLSGNWSNMSSEGAFFFNSSSLAALSSFCCL